jgi:2-oxoglutarate dehydrogenase E2 component (dihydrolipoamide succinyltransferase)
VAQQTGVRTEVTMPQMGETVTEGTIVRWLKSPGDEVALDEPLLEISTDKVDAEIPSPAAGTLTVLLVEEGETVAIGTPIARIGDGAPEPDGQGEANAPTPEDGSDDEASASDGASAAEPEGRPDRTGGNGFLSPVVRRLAQEHHLDLDALEGSGAGGRITRDDVLAALEHAAEEPPPAEGIERVPFTSIRRTIATRMLASQHEAAHTLVVTEVDYHHVAPAKEAAGLTWLPFVARAAVDALAEHPSLNAHVGEDHLDLHRAVHLGIAVDLEHEGLVVPVLRDADRLRLRPLAEGLADRASAARARTLGPDDLNGGTFTITNAGRYGTLLTAPIINRPQAAILATDGVKVRPVAVPLPGGEHGLAFHPVGNLCLSFDHRAVDGAYASSFLARVRDLLQERDWTAEVDSGGPA